MSSLILKQIKVLEHVGFPFSGVAREDGWIKNYNELKKFHSTHGHCTVPQNVLPLGDWVNNQRCSMKKYENVESSSLTPKRV
jgi:hypothetical protein